MMTRVPVLLLVPIKLAAQLAPLLVVLTVLLLICDRGGTHLFVDQTQMFVATGETNNVIQLVEEEEGVVQVG